MRRAGHTFLLCLACLCLGPLAGSAAAAPSIESSSLSLSTSQAGAHADLTLSVALEDPGEPETARDAVIGLPPGYFLYPILFPRCDDAQLGELECPTNSQVGLVTVENDFPGDPDPREATPLYLLTPADGRFARLGFVVPLLEEPVETSVTVKPGNEYGLELALEDLPASVPLRSLDLTIWGVPPAAEHDGQRGYPPAPGGRPSSLPLMPFARNPTSCGSGESLSVEVDSYEDPGDFATADGPTPSISGCGKLAFPANLDLSLTSTEAGVPVGLDLTAEIPQNMSPNDLSSSDAEEIFVSLPPALELDEGALTSASSAGSFAAAVLGAEAPLEGSVLFDGVESADSYRLLLVGGGSGIDLSVPAFLEYDADFESWAVDLPNLPQLPFEELELQLAGAAGPFIAGRCGPFEAVSGLAPWSGRPPMLASHALTVSSGPGGGPCPVPRQKTAPPSSPPPAVTPLPPPKPTVKFRRRPPARTSDRTPTFRFVSSIAGSSFECKLGRRPLQRCKSPLTLPRLGLGRHTFKVRAIAPSGAKSSFAKHSFVVRP